MGIRCPSSSDETNRAFFCRCGDPIFAGELAFDVGVAELDGDVVERMLVEERRVARIDDYIEDANVLIFKDDAMMGLLLDGDGIRCGALSF